ncbi:MAG: hypothetical protein K2M57_06165 [Paramuribaculum sp.]|nr:hypothetical protein [Paramuribaculum sp.]
MKISVKSSLSVILGACAWLAAMIAPADIAAQDTTNPYSKLGYGLLRDNATSAQRQMGGVGYALRSGRQINVMNPASYAGIDTLTFLFDMGVDVSVNKLSEGSVSKTSNGGGLDYVTMQFPLGRYMGGSFGLVPFSSVGYAFENEIANGMSQRQGNGGLNQLYLGVAGRPFKGFSIGANINYLFGSITNDVLTTPTGGSTALFEQVMEVRDYRLEFGVQYGFEIGTADRLTVGAIYSPSKSIIGHAWVTKYDSTSDIDSNGDAISDTVVQRMKMQHHFSTPDTWGGGVNYQWRNALTVEADFTYQPWSKAKFAEMDNFAATRFADRYRVAIGGEYRHRERGSYLERMRFRLGASYNRDYVMVGNNNVRDYGVSCGFGFPTPIGKTLINLGFEWRHREAYPSDLIKENRFTITLGINFNELWFFQNKIN